VKNFQEMKSVKPQVKNLKTVVALYRKKTK
jgi:hypothetical protein